jgi:hypothetical protein
MTSHHLNPQEGPSTDGEIPKMHALLYPAFTPSGDRITFDITVK